MTRNQLLSSCPSWCHPWVVEPEVLFGLDHTKPFGIPEKAPMGTISTRADLIVVVIWNPVRLVMTLFFSSWVILPGLPKQIPQGLNPQRQQRRKYFRILFLVSDFPGNSIFIKRHSLKIVYFTDYSNCQAYPTPVRLCTILGKILSKG